jgi:PAS domain S-box-containing protein
MNESVIILYYLIKNDFTPKQPLSSYAETHLTCMVPKQHNLPERKSRKNLRMVLFFCVALIFAALSLLFFASLHHGDGASAAVAFSVYVTTTAFSAGCMACGVLIFIALQVKQQRDRTEKILSASEERYRSIIASSNTGAWEYHADTKYQWCSPEYFTMLGYDQPSILKMDPLKISEIWVDHLHPDDRERALQSFFDYIASGSRGMYESTFRLRHKDGSWIWVLSRGQTLRNPDGSLSAMTLGTHINITEKKILEIALIKYNERLLRYAFSNAHQVRGPVARLLGLIQLFKLETDLSYPWFFEKVENEVHSVDAILNTIAQEFDELEEHKPSLN